MRLISIQILGVLSLIGCGTSTGPAGSVDLLTTRLHVTQSTLRPSETTDVTIVVTNRSTRPVEFHSSCTGPVDRIYEDGKRVDTGFCAIPETSELRIEPGDSVVAHARFPVSRYVGGGQYQPLPAGSYSLVGGWEVGGMLRAPSPPAVIDITP
jgi:hypothetical protein